MGPGDSSGMNASPLLPRLRHLITARNIGITIGIGVMTYGLSLATDFKISALISMLKWSVGIALLHDMVWLPITVGVGHLLRRCPKWMRVPLGSALALSTALTLVFLPFILGFGKRSAIPSLLPRNYLTGLFAYLGVVWLICGGIASVSWWRSRSEAAL